MCRWSVYRVMSRLIQGDVGSGKTLVAAALIWFTWKGGYSSAFMAPTEILAEQHYATLSGMLAPLGLRVGKLTGAMSAKEKRLAKEALKNGEFDLIVGTHALFSEDVELYVQASRHFVDMLREFSPAVEQYSIDEAWVDMTGTERLWGAPRLAAERMRQRIWEELGFTVNVGISSNKLLAKMAGDFEKPNKVHTLFPEEMETKFWPLPVRDLFLVGAATERKLKMLGIYTIGDLAKADGDVTVCVEEG